jgi:hypothetical protein
MELIFDSRAALNGRGEEELVCRDDARSVIAQVPTGGAVLLYGWRQGVDDLWRARALELVSAVASGRLVEIGVCGHGAGAPECWCRPPLPGLWLAFARRHGIDPRLSVFLAAKKVHEAMARTLGMKVLPHSHSLGG